MAESIMLDKAKDFAVNIVNFSSLQTPAKGLRLAPPYAHRFYQHRKGKPTERVFLLKIHGVKRQWSRPLWVHFKKHYCPACMNLLTTTKASKIVNSNSEEAKNYDFSSGDTDMAGNIKFLWTEFLCIACGKTYSLQEIRENEKKTK